MAVPNNPFAALIVNHIGMTFDERIRRYLGDIDASNCHSMTFFVVGLVAVSATKVIVQA